MNPIAGGLTSTSLFQSSATPPKSSSSKDTSASTVNTTGGSLFDGKLAPITSSPFNSLTVEPRSLLQNRSATASPSPAANGANNTARVGFGAPPPVLGGATTGFGGATTGFGGATTGFGGTTTGFGGATTGFGGGLPVFGLDKENSKGEVPLTTGFQYRELDISTIEGRGQCITFMLPFLGYSFEVSYFATVANVSEANDMVLCRNFALMTTVLGSVTAHLGFKSTYSSTYLH
jgi:hypothetical protein